MSIQSSEYGAVMSEKKQQSVLVVDDSPLARELTIRILSDLPIDIVTAISGEEAVEIFPTTDFALLLLDVAMGGISGLEAASRIRALKHDNSDVPIIFITSSNTDTSSIFEGYEAGAADYLLKPVDSVELRSKVNVFCRLKEQRRLIAEQLSEIKTKNDELQSYIDEIKVLRGFVPICASCKSIRDDTGYWQSIEQYVSAHSEAEFSHSICPGCSEKLYPGMGVNKSK
jgi:phosphoserine phosphatase RsbU/P